MEQFFTPWFRWLRPRRSRHDRTVLLPIASGVLTFLIGAITIGGAGAAATPESKVGVAGRTQAGTALKSAPMRRSEFKGTINPNGYTSAKVCGSCHVDIYKSWKRSMHAFSVTDPIFDAAYMLAVRDGGEPARRLCLRCHAPLTLVTRDYGLTEAITVEGVTCDFCHTVTAVHLGNRAQPFTLEPGLVKRSVIKDADSPAHKVAYSELHSAAEFCGSCHNYVAPNGTPLMSTYDEWRSGPYAAKGIPCQHCHMGLRPGRLVREEIKPSGPEIHIHDLIHDADQLRSALRVDIMNVEALTDRLNVRVRVSNVGSGHKVPTGIPSRQIRLTVRVSSGGSTLERERVYQKVLADKDGRQLTHVVDMLLHGASVISDNRIGPLEDRLELFSFALPTSREVKVVASLNYLYSPILLQEVPMNIELGSAEKRVRIQRAGR